MTKQEILEGNKLIAKFMEIEIKTNFNNLFYYSNQPYYYVDGKSREEVLDKASSYFKYHISWDWLMPVVKKISEENDIVRIGINSLLLKYNYCIDDIFEIIVNHIKLKNEQKEK